MSVLFFIIVAGVVWGLTIHEIKSDFGIGQKKKKRGWLAEAYYDILVLTSLALIGFIIIIMNREETVDISFSKESVVSMLIATILLVVTLNLFVFSKLKRKDEDNKDNKREYHRYRNDYPRYNRRDGRKRR